MVNKTQYYHYFVEGQCEEKLINALKIPPENYLISGKVEVFNVIQKRLSKQRILSIKNNATIIFVYDTDVENNNILEENVEMLKRYGFTKIVHIQSVNYPPLNY